MSCIDIRSFFLRCRALFGLLTGLLFCNVLHGIVLRNVKRIFYLGLFLFLAEAAVTHGFFDENPYVVIATFF